LSSDGDELFAEKFLKVTFRNLTGNPRMYIKNVDLRNQQVKRDRMIAYWKENSSRNLPPIKQVRSVSAARRIDQQ
jgi:hypothetical protein